MKRFTDTSMWSDQWFQDLSVNEKLVWRYLVDNCDNAGVWNTNFKLAEFQIGTKINWEATLESLKKNIHSLSNGRIWIPKFISFQYGKLSPDAKVHQNVIRLLEYHGLLNAYEFFIECKDNWKEQIVSHSNGIVMGLEWYKDKDKDKDRESHQKPIVTEEDMLNELKDLYPNVNLRGEMNKAKAWLLANPGRRLTKKFFVNWINKIDQPLQTSPSVPQMRNYSNGKID